MTVGRSGRVPFRLLLRRELAKPATDQAEEGEGEGRMSMECEPPHGRIRLNGVDL